MKIILTIYINYLERETRSVAAFVIHTYIRRTPIETYVHKRNASSFVLFL